MSNKNLYSLWGVLFIICAALGFIPVPSDAVQAVFTTVSVLFFLPPVVLGSILYQSCALAYMYYDGVFLQGVLFYLGTRSIQFAITLVLDVAVVYLLFKAGIFNRLGIWPRQRKEKSWD